MHFLAENLILKQFFLQLLQLSEFVTQELLEWIINSNISDIGMIPVIAIA